jgi:multiple sugar transport system ATP-binding protein
MAQVVFEKIWKIFGQHTVVPELNLNIADGEFLVFVGPSGCGKTTTLRMLAGLEMPTHGRILIDGRDVTLAPPGQRDIAMVFQSYALYPHLSVYKNLAFGPEVRSDSKEKI